MAERHAAEQREEIRPGCAAAEHVPPERARRDALLAAIRARLAADGLCPQLSADQLSAVAERVLTEVGCDRAYRKWCMVQINNESWRPRLAAVPYQRRLLLLPQCLRRHDVCTAEVDELGLVCAGCGACDLYTFLSEAGSLGYVTLVSEGTAAVLSVIKTGRIDAFVGVSCLSTLEKVFPFMALLQVPALAFPLLVDGCVDTACDTDLVLAAIRERAT